MPYDAIWQDPAFQEYVEFSTLEGFVAPAQAMDRHRVHGQQLMAGNRNPDAAVPLANAEVQVRVLRDYMPGLERVSPAPQAVARAAAQPPIELAIDVQQRLLPPSPEIRQEPQLASPQIQQQSEQLQRRSARQRRPNSRFDV